MFKNYFRIGFRQLWKNKVFSAINIFGLSIGIGFVLLIGSYIRGELQVNKEIKDGDHIYMIRSKWKNADMGYDFATLAPLSKTLKEDYPSLVKNYYHHDGISSIVSKDDKKFSESLQPGDNSFLTMMGFDLLYGDAATALNKPNAIVLTGSKARKYFGKEDVVGQTLSIQSFSGSKQDFEITGVLKDPAFNTITSCGHGTSKGTAEFFLPKESLKFFGRAEEFESWQNPSTVSYIQLMPGADVAKLDAAVKQIIDQHAAPEVKSNLEVYFTPIKDYYLESNNGIVSRMLYALGFVALFILLMAIINFINISIGNSVSRLKEIGVRKVMGSSKQQLIFQFLAESILLVAVAVIFAMLIYVLARPFFSNMLGKELASLLSFPAMYLLVPFAVILFVGTLAGIYPAFVLSRQRSVDSLKGKLETVKEKIWFRHSLIGLQFITAIMVYVAAIFINDQVNFFLTKDLGYKKEQVITAKVPRDWTAEGVRRMEAFRNDFSRIPEVSSASFSFEIPDGASAGDNNIIFKASDDSEHGITATSMFTDEKYLSTYGITLVAGKFFNANGGLPDSLGVVLNETAVKNLGFTSPDAAIGQLVRFQGNVDASIVEGVVKDFHFGPLQQSIRPMYFVHVQNVPLYRYLSFKINTANTSKSIAAINQKWSTLLPGAPFDYTFMDDTLARMYSTETQMKKASEAATAIALVIVLLGVFGIVTQSITKRAKEIGIRKVLGASVLQVLLLFGKEFSWLIIGANLVAWPLTWFLVNKWLMSYAYRIDISLVPFISVAIILALLTAIIITIRTLRIALANPVKSLRTE